MITDSAVSSNTNSANIIFSIPSSYAPLHILDECKIAWNLNKKLDKIRHYEARLLRIRMYYCFIQRRYGLNYMGLNFKILIFEWFIDARPCFGNIFLKAFIQFLNPLLKTFLCAFSCSHNFI